MNTNPPSATALTARQRGELAASSSPTPPSRALLPPGATVRAIVPADGVGPFVDLDGARAVFHMPGSGNAQMLALDGGELREARLEGLDPDQPHTLHPRRGGLGALDERGTWRWQPAAEPGHRPESELVSGVLPPGDRIARFAVESVNDAGYAVDAIVGEGDDLLVTGWSRSGGISAGAPLAGPFIPPEERSGWAFQLWGTEAVAWSPSGAHIAVADAFGVLILGWDGRELRPWRRLLEPGVICIAWGAAGLAGGTSRGRLVVWNPFASKALRWSGEGGPYWAQCVAWAPDGRLASGGHDGAVRVWRPACTESLLATLMGHSWSVNSVAWGPGGELAAGVGHLVHVWDGVDAASPRDTFDEHRDAVKAVAWSASGPLASASGDRTVRIHDPATRGAGGDRVLRHAQWVETIAWGPGGVLASGGGEGGARLWEPNAVRPALATLPGPTEAWVCGLAWGPRGELVSASVDNALRVWIEPLADPAHSTFRGRSTYFRAVAWGPRGELASASNDPRVGVWEPSAPDPLRATLEGHAAALTAVAWSADGRLASGSGDRTIRCWEPGAVPLRRGPTQTVPHSPSSLAWAGRERLVSVCGGMVRLSRPGDGANIDSSMGRFFEGARSVACGPSGRLASGGHEGLVRVLVPEAGTPKRATLRGHTGDVGSVAWDPSGRLATASSDATVRIWDPLEAPPLRATLEGHTRVVYSVAWGPRGLLASGSGDNTVRIWEPGDARPLRATLDAHSGEVMSVSWSPRGVLASAGHDCTIRLWNLQGAHPRPWSPHAMALHRDREGLHIHSTQGGPWRVPHLLLDVDWVVVGPQIPDNIPAYEQRCPQGRLVEHDGRRFGVGGGALHVFQAGPANQSTPWTRTVFAGAAPADWRPSEDADWPGVLDGTSYAELQVVLAPSSPGAVVEVAWQPLPDGIVQHGDMLHGADGQPLCPLGSGARCVTRPGGSLLAVDDSGGIALIHANHRAALSLVLSGHVGPVVAVALGPFGDRPQMLQLMTGDQHTFLLPRFTRGGYLLDSGAPAAAIPKRLTTLDRP